MNRIAAAARDACDQKYAHDHHGATQTDIDNHCDKTPDGKGMKDDDLVAQYLHDRLADYYNMTLSRSYLWGLDASAGYNDNTYYLASTAAKLTSQDIPWSVDAFAGATVPNTALLLLGSVAYQKTYTAQKSATLCPTSATAVVLQCVTGSVGAPTEKDAVLLSFEPRYQFPVAGPFALFGVNSISLDPKFTYDVKNDVYGFNSQIVLGQISSKSSSDSTMSAGFQFGWQSDKHVFVGGVFASAPISFFSGPS
jgi:hypothetical protein